MSRLNLLHLGFASTPGHKPRPTAGWRAVCTEQDRCITLPKTPKSAPAGGRQLNYRYQSIAVATEANPGVFGGLLGCSQHPKSKPGRKIKKCKKRTDGGPQLNYRYQSTAAAMEANPGGFGGLFLTAAIQTGP